MKALPQSSDIGAVTVYYLPMPVKDVVTWRGSFRSEPDLEDGEEILQELVASLLNKGTQRRDRFAIADFLENRGAALSFRSGGGKVVFSGQTLEDDADDVFALMAEMLREPAFDPVEIEKAKTKVVSALRRATHNTGHRAAIGLSQSLYEVGHPNYAFSTEEEIDRIALIGYSDISTFYDRHFQPSKVDLVVAGEVEPGCLDATIEKHLSDWTSADHQWKSIADATRSVPREVMIPVEDRENLDIRMGHVLNLRRDHPDYVALFVGTYVLGGNFSARLMRQVRDEMGLTYGIGASLVGIEPEHNGHFQMSVTLSQARLDEGIEATKRVFQAFVLEGAGEEELMRQQQSIAGSFKVRQSTTSGAVRALLYSLERNLGADYLERFPEEVCALSTSEVSRAVKLHLDPDALHLVTAGSPPQ